jgi:hypothetical protein
MTYAKVSGRKPLASGGWVRRCGRCARSLRSGPECAAGYGPSLRPGVAAVSFEVELAFEGLVDRLDGLAQRFEQRRAGPFVLAFAGRAQQVQVPGGESGLELGAVVLPVGDEGLPGP